jgi:hypothetical protein
LHKSARKPEAIAAPLRRLRTEDGSTIERFADLTRRLIGLSRQEVRNAENEFKAEQRKRRAAKQ